MKVDIKNAQGYKILKDSIRVEDNIVSRSIASFTVIDENGQLHFNQGLPVEISNYTQDIPIYNGYHMPYKTRARVNYIKGKSQIKYSETDKEMLTWNISETSKNRVYLDDGVYMFEQKTIKKNIWEVTNFALYATLSNVYTFRSINYTTTNGLVTMVGVMNKFERKINTLDERGFWISSHLYVNIEKSIINNIMLEHSLNEVDAFLKYLEDENIYAYFELATPVIRPAEVIGLESVNPIINGVEFGKELRSSGTVFDEFKDGFIHRKTKLVEVGFWQNINQVFIYEWKLQRYEGVLEPIGWYDVSPLQLTYAFNEPSADAGYRWVQTGNTQNDGYYYFRLGNILTKDNNNLLINAQYIRDNRHLIIKVEDDIIDDIVGSGLLYEWKKQYQSFDPLGWFDVMPQELTWSLTQPSASTGYRWVKTGNEKNDIDEIDAFCMYCIDNNITLICEDNPSTEYVTPLLLDFQVGDKITILNYLDTDILLGINYRLYFKGFVDYADEEWLTEYNNQTKKVLKHTVHCKNNRYLADKRYIRKSYVNAHCGDIVRDIINSKLHEEGITEGIIEQGEFMEEAVFKSVKCSKAFERLAEANDYIWYIDHNRKLHFHARETIRNEVPLTEADISHVRVTLGNSEYRNKQYIEGGKALTDLLIETFNGDGANRNFTLSFPCGEKPEIIVDNEPVSPDDIGIKGVDPEEDVLDENEEVIEYAKKWFWAKDSNIISQSTKEDVLPIGTSVTIKYHGLFDIIVSVPELTEINTRAELEENSGIIEHIEEEVDNTSLSAAFKSALAKLKKYAVDGKAITVRTRRNDLYVGQMIRVNIPKHDIDEDTLISKITVTTENNTIVWHEVELLVGPEVADFIKMFENISSKKTRTIYENIEEKETLVQMFESKKVWQQNDTPNIFRELYPSEELYPSNTLYPVFEPNQRILYMEVVSEDTTVARVKHIKQTLEPNRVISIFYLDNNTANTTITALAFYGGNTATEEYDSGVLVDYHELDTEYNKTLLEIIQIIRVDEKGEW
jgi:hypothetical protein